MVGDDHLAWNNSPFISIDKYIYEDDIYNENDNGHHIYVLPTEPLCIEQETRHDRTISLW